MHSQHAVKGWGTKEHPYNLDFTPTVHRGHGIPPEPHPKWRDHRSVSTQLSLCYMPGIGFASCQARNFEGWYHEVCVHIGSSRSRSDGDCPSDELVAGLFAHNHGWHARSYTDHGGRSWGLQFWWEPQWRVVNSSMLKPSAQPRDLVTGQSPMVDPGSFLVCCFVLLATSLNWSCSSCLQHVWRRNKEKKEGREPQLPGKWVIMGIETLSKVEIWNHKNCADILIVFLLMMSQVIRDWR